MPTEWEERTLEDKTLPTAVGAFIGVVGSMVVAGVLSSASSLTTNVNVALALMIVVVIAAAIGGRGAGALSAVVAALSYDFFQTEPQHSLRINSSDDVVTALLLLASGLIVGQIAARAQLNRVATQSGRSEIGRLRRLSELAAGGASASEVTDAATAELTQLLSLRSCRFEPPPYADIASIGWSVRASSVAPRNGSPISGWGGMASSYPPKEWSFSSFIEAPRWVASSWYPPRARAPRSKSASWPSRWPIRSAPRSSRPHQPAAAPRRRARTCSASRCGDAAPREATPGGDPL